MFLRILMRRVFAGMALNGWTSLLLPLAILYGVGYISMRFWEGADSTLGSLGNYTWWFVVTIATVGYGDIAPVTVGGRATAIVIILVGITALALSATKGFDAYLNLRRKKMKGELQLHCLGHFLILGFQGDETRRLVKEILADANNAKREIVLCDSTVESNPLPEQVQFVRGPLTSQDVLQRACAKTAETIIVHCEEDFESILVALAARHANPHAHVVVELDDPDSITHIRRIDPYIECVVPQDVGLLYQATVNPGSTGVFERLFSSACDSTVYSMVLSGNEWTFGELVATLKRNHEAVAIAIMRDGKTDVNPPSPTVVPGGTTLFYIADRRLPIGAL